MGCLLSQHTSYPLALPSPDLQPHQGWERKGDLNASHGVIRYSRLQAVKGQKEYLWGPGAALYRKDSRCLQSLFQNNFPIPHQPSRAKRICSMYPPIEAAASCALGAQDCRSLLSLPSLCSSEVGQTKSIIGLCPQLPGTMYGCYTQHFSKAKTSFHVQELRKKKRKKSLWYKQWKSKFNLRKQKNGFPKNPTVFWVLGGAVRYCNMWLWKALHCLGAGRTNVTREVQVEKMCLGKLCQLRSNNEEGGCSEDWFPCEIP